VRQLPRVGDDAPQRVSTAARPAQPYAAALARRALLGQLVLFAVALAVSSATDEGGVALAERLARTLPLAPLTSALAAALVVLQARRRGEERALAAVGLAPATLGLWCALVASATPSAAGLAMAVGAVDVAEFYPSPPRAPIFVDDGVTFSSAELGVAVGRDGDLRPLAAPATGAGAHALPSHARGVAALVSVVSGLALALSATRARARPARGGREPRGAAARALAAVAPGLVASVATLLTFQLAAAGRVPTALAAAPMLGLLVREVVAYRSAR